MEGINLHLPQQQTMKFQQQGVDPARIGMVMVEMLYNRFFL